MNSILGLLILILGISFIYRNFSIKLLANVFTLFNLFCGCISIVLILQNGILSNISAEGPEYLFLPENMYWASAFIGIAAVIDFLDGLLARSLNAVSEMGKQLDSLADVVSFGVAPSMIVYQFLRFTFAQQDNGLDVSVIWLLPAFLVPCAGAYRLARFNLDKSQTSYFKGVPIPAAGLLVASFPLIYLFSGNQMIMQLMLNKWFWYAVSATISALMVSRLPMFALKFKGFSLKHDLPKISLLLLSIILGIVIKWLAVPVVFIVYVLLSLGMRKQVVGAGKPS